MTAADQPVEQNSFPHEGSDNDSVGSILNLSVLFREQLFLGVLSAFFIVIMKQMSLTFLKHSSFLTLWFNLNENKNKPILVGP